MTLTTLKLENVTICQRLNIMNDDATINEKYGGKYAGMDRYEARKAMVEDLEEQGLSCKSCSTFS